MELTSWRRIFPTMAAKSRRARFAKLLSDEPELKVMCDKLKVK